MILYINVEIKLMQNSRLLNDLMNEEAEEQINASRYERSNHRKDYRNGYKKRSLLITDGKSILDKPQFSEIGVPA